MADTALLLGLAGVTGTIVGTATGAAIAARSTSALERRREKRAERDEALAVQAAARLVWMDLAAADSNLEWAALRRRWHPDRVRLPMDAWEQHRYRLALAITDPDDWHTVAVAMAALDHLRETTRAAMPEPQEIDADLAESFTAARQLVIAAGEVLRRAAGLPKDVVHGN